MAELRLKYVMEMKFQEKLDMTKVLKKTKTRLIKEEIENL